MSQVGQARATLDDLYQTPGKAELIGGRIVQQMATGRTPNRVVGRICRRLDEHAEQAGKGEAYTDNMGFAIAELASGRESFSPDASYYDGPMPANRMRFIEGPPKFAAEVRNENDYSEAAEADMTDKRGRLLRSRHPRGVGCRSTRRVYSRLSLHRSQESNHLSPR
jgi:Uma2 family endonuclease